MSFIDARNVAAVSVRALLSDSQQQQHIGKAYSITAQEAIYGQAAESSLKKLVE